MIHIVAVYMNIYLNRLFKVSLNIICTLSSLLANIGVIMKADIKNSNANENVRI